MEAYHPGHIYLIFLNRVDDRLVMSSYPEESTLTRPTGGKIKHPGKAV